MCKLTCGRDVAIDGDVADVARVEREPQQMSVRDIKCLVADSEGQDSSGVRGGGIDHSHIADFGSARESRRNILFRCFHK